MAYSNRISLLCCSVVFICKCQHSCDIISPLFCFLKWVHTCTLDVSRSKYHYQLFLVLLFVWPPFLCIQQNKNKENSINSTEFNEEEPQEQVGEADEEIDAVEAFKVCHTSRKKGMSDVAREAVVSLAHAYFLFQDFSNLIDICTCNLCLLPCSTSQYEQVLQDS